MSGDHTKLPRLYIDGDLEAGASLSLPPGPSHYLRAVMRRGPGDGVRLFNGRQGEWLGVIAEVTKKDVVLSLEQCLHAQPPAIRGVHLVFAPIKKARMDGLIEKAVELGVTDFHPVLTRHTEARQLNDDRIRQQIAEAAEQCERLTLPRWNAPADLAALLASWPSDIRILAALEREEGLPSLRQALPDGGAVGFLIGPEGGFAPEEKDMIRQCAFVTPVGLGPAVLRSETAALICLAAVL